MGVDGSGEIDGGSGDSKADGDISSVKSSVDVSRIKLVSPTVGKYSSFKNDNCLIYFH